MSLPRMFMQGLGSLNGNSQDFSDTIQSLLNSSGIDISQFNQPPVDILENNINITIYVDVPGVESKSLDIDFYNNKIEITGNREKPYNLNSIKQEILYGDFTRKINIPISVTNRNSVKVSCKNGVLKITIDKVNEERNRFTVNLEENNEVKEEIA